MQPKTHAEIINLSNIAGPIVCIPVLFVLIIKASIYYSALPIFLFFVFIILFIYISCGSYLFDVQGQIAIAECGGLKPTFPHSPLNLITIVRPVVRFIKKPVL